MGLPCKHQEMSTSSDVRCQPMCADAGSHSASPEKSRYSIRLSRLSATAYHMGKASRCVEEALHDKLGASKKTVIYEGPQV